MIVSRWRGPLDQAGSQEKKEEKKSTAHFWFYGVTRAKKEKDLPN